MSHTENYFDFAIANLKCAKIIFDHSNGDEYQLNLSAFWIQQSIELAIKYILFENGIDTIKTKTHSLPKLAEIAEKEKIDLYLTDYLLDRLDIITDWEAKTRYYLGYYVAHHNVEQALKETYKYLEIVKEKSL